MILQSPIPEEVRKMSYLLKLFHDRLPSHSEVTPGLESQHTIIYVWKGSATVNGTLVKSDSAVYNEDFALIKSGPSGTVLWRWELVPESDPLHLLQGKDVNSMLRLSRKIKMFELVATSKWLFRLDCIMGKQGSTGLHSHPGSGIRCLLKGNLRAVSEKGESSDNRSPGDAWYEEGSYPLVSITDEGVKASFLRCMVLPPEYAKYPDTAIWIEGVKKRRAAWKCLVQKVITLR
jgi:hypothetical protein